MDSLEPPTQPPPTIVVHRQEVRASTPGPVWLLLGGAIFAMGLMAGALALWGAQTLRASSLGDEGPQAALHDGASTPAQRSAAQLQEDGRAREQLPPGHPAPHWLPPGHPPADAPASHPSSQPRARQVLPHAGGGRGLHPVFDCQNFEALPKPPSGSGRALKSIATLSARGAALKGKKVRVWARVMAVYPNILGVNWLRLCDVASGDVLVVSSAQWAHPGMPVLAEGRLALEKNIGNAYTFPILLEEATLKGDAVLDRAPGHPGPARDPAASDDPVDL